MKYHEATNVIDQIHKSRNASFSYPTIHQPCPFLPKWCTVEYCQCIVGFVNLVYYHNRRCQYNGRLSRYKGSHHKNETVVEPCYVFLHWQFYNESILGTPLLGGSPLTRSIPCTRKVMLLRRPRNLFCYCVVIRFSSQTWLCKHAPQAI